MNTNKPIHSLPILTTIAAVSFAFIAATPALAGDPCEEHWDNALGDPGFNGTVRALIRFRGDLVAAGSFTAAGGETVNRVAMWNPDAGEAGAWEPLGSGIETGQPGNSPQVLALAVYPPEDGDLFVGGYFFTAGGISVSHIARWDGEQWDSPGSMNGRVRALTVYNGELIAGGDFSQAGGVGAWRIARFNGETWQPLGFGIGGPRVHALAPLGDDLIVGGDFTEAYNHDNDVEANRIARWDGEQWHSIGPSAAGMNDIVLALGEYPPESGQLIAAGEFTHAFTSDCCLEHNGQGCVDPACAALVCAEFWWCCDDKWYDECAELALDLCDACADGEVNHIARWDGEGWQPLGEGTNEWIRAVASYNGQLIVGGDFTVAGSNPASRIARWTVTDPDDAGAWSPLGVGADWRVYSLLTIPPAPDNDEEQLIVGGLFDTAGGLPANRIATWIGCPPQPDKPGDLNGDGTVDTDDLLILLASWGPCDDCDDCAADLDGNCNVGVSDLLILLANWG